MTQIVWQQRWHPLREEWVLYTSHRGGRPWIGEMVARRDARPPAYDPTCALCPGNERLGGLRNPAYTGVMVFTNDLPCFCDDAPAAADVCELYRARPAFGTAEVVCYHPDHSKTFAELTVDEAAAVVDAWTDRYRELSARPTVDYILIFENNGSLVGTSNPHPHCQIYAGNLIYGIAEREAAVARTYQQRTGRSLLLDVVEREAAGPRVICRNEAFLACVPWFARYAYEVHVYPQRQAASLADLTEFERRKFGALMREVSIRYDNLWQMRMPYVMAVHQAPCDGGDYAAYPFHLEYHPPLRSPEVMKYLAGPEIGGGSMTNESNPDEKAAELRAVAPTLYRR